MNGARLLFGSRTSILDLQCYNEHPAVIAARAGRESGDDNARMDPVPIGLYLDGVTYQSSAAGRQDSVTGIWIINLLTETRFLMSVHRSSDACQCGCRGWCSTYVFLENARWQLDHMQRGVRPEKWPNGEEVDGPRELSYSTALIFVKGDWSEHSKSLGLAQWGSYYCPCSLCELPLPELHESYDSFANNLDWPLRTHDAYESACARCEVQITIRSNAEMTLLVNALAFSKGRGIRGRRIATPLQLDGKHMCVGDRLEPSTDLPDTHSLEKSHLPVRITFWRPRIDADGKKSSTL